MNDQQALSSLAKHYDKAGGTQKQPSRASEPDMKSVLAHLESCLQAIHEQVDAVRSDNLQ